MVRIIASETEKYIDLRKIFLVNRLTVFSSNNIQILNVCMYYIYIRTYVYAYKVTPNNAANSKLSFGKNLSTGKKLIRAFLHLCAINLCI